MEDARIYGQQNFNLPHDVVQLPSGGKFYKNKQKSIKVGYLTAQDENVLISAGRYDNIISTLLKNKIYEPNFNVDELLEGDVEAILIFLRNTAFGADYNYTLKDPKTGKDFKHTVMLDELDIIENELEPNKRGFFEFKLPKSGKNVECKVLNTLEINELNKFSNTYPESDVAPIVTKRLEKIIVSVDGIEDRETIVSFINTLPIADSKFIRNTINKCEPRLNLERVATAPSGEKVNVRVTFGAEFFRPFF